MSLFARSLLVRSRSPLVQVAVRQPSLRSVLASSRFYASEPSQTPADLIQSSETLKAFIQDPEARELLEKMRVFLQEEGIDQTNPPSGLKMMKLLANSDFRKLTMDLQELMTNKGLDVKEVSKLGALFGGGGGN